jgi:hypothetical protein
MRPLRTGKVLALKGNVMGEPFREPEFFNAMASTWLRTTPAAYKLKDVLLDVK